MLESDLQQAVIDVLRLHGFLVAHFRPARTDKGWATPVAADGAGFPDLVAMRPQCPVIFVECKTQTALSKDQRDWLTAGDGDGRFYAVVTPRNLQPFIRNVRLLHEQYPLPSGWTEQLGQRKWRHTMKKEAKRVTNRAAKRRAEAGDEGPDA